jgi:hypothetical protein
MRPWKTLSIRSLTCQIRLEWREACRDLLVCIRRRRSFLSYRKNNSLHPTIHLSICLLYEKLRAAKAVVQPEFVESDPTISILCHLWKSYSDEASLPQRGPRPIARRLFLRATRVLISAFGGGPSLWPCRPFIPQRLYLVLSNVISPHNSGQVSRMVLLALQF